MPGLEERRLPSAVALAVGWLSLAAAWGQTPPAPEPIPATAPAAPAADGPPPDAAADPAAAAPPPSEAEPETPAAPLVETAPAGLRQTRWRFPPVSWNGAISYDLRLDQAKGVPRLTEHLMTVRLGLGSYIYQPWLATVGMDLAFTQGRARVAGDVEPGRDDQFLSGGIRVDVFPRSRFPFSASFNAADSRLDPGNATTLTYQSREWVLTQAYRPPVGNWSVNMAARRRHQSSDDFGDDTQQSVTADMTASWKHQNLQVNAADTVAKAESTGERTHFRNVAARHVYAPVNEFNLNSSANWSNTRNRLVLGDTALSIAQANTLALWRPRLDLTVTASVRGQVLRDDTGTGFEARTYGGTLGTTWEAGRNLRLGASLGATLLDSDGTRAKTANATASANYQGDTIALDSFNYDWFAGANANAARATGRSDNGASVQVGHSLNRAVRLDDFQALSFTLGQTLSVQRNSADTSGSPNLRESTRLDTHSAAVAWNGNGAGSSYYGRLGVNDSREIGGSGARFLLINAQVSGNWDIGRDQTVSGDLSAQRLRQRSGDFESDPGAGIVLPGERLGNNNVSGEASYNHRRWWGVPRLRFSARLRLARDVQSASRSVVLIPDRETRFAEARTDYLIGRLEASVVARVSDVDGIWRRLLLLRVVRSFGGGQL